MGDIDLTQGLAQWCHEVLAWIGFGTLAGLLAKAIMPGRDPGGAIATVCMGIGGSVIGCGTLLFFNEKFRIAPLSPVGFVVATAGAFVLLFFYRLLGGRFFREGDRGHGHGLDGPVSGRRSRRSAGNQTIIIDD